MIEINLLRKEKIKRERARRRIKIPFNLGIFLVVFFFVLMLIVFASISIYQIGKINGLKKGILRAEREKEALQEEVRLVNELAQKQSEVMVKLGIIEKLDQDRFFEAHLLQEICEAVPDYLWLTSVVEKPPGITIEGMAYSNFIIADFLERLALSPYFKNVELISVEKAESGTKEVAKFTLTSELIHYQPSSAGGS